MSLTSHALASLYSEQKHAHVSRYVAEQTVIQSTRGNLKENEWHQPGLRRQEREVSCWSNNDRDYLQNCSSPKHHGQTPSFDMMRAIDGENYVATPSGTGDICRKPDSTYQKRARHKMREDIVHMSEEKGRRPIATVGKKPQPKAKRVKKKKGLVDISAVENPSNKNRLTLKPNHNLGLFKRGRASTQIEKRGLPDLTFCEMAFLQGVDKRKRTETSKPSSESGLVTSEPSKTPFFPPSIQDTRIDSYEQQFFMSAPDPGSLGASAFVLDTSLGQGHSIANQQTGYHIRNGDGLVICPSETHSQNPTKVIEDSGRKLDGAERISKERQDDVPEKNILPFLQGIHLPEMKCTETSACEQRTDELIKNAHESLSIGNTARVADNAFCSSLEDTAAKGPISNPSPVREIESSKLLSTLLRACDDLLFDEASYSISKPLETQFDNYVDGHTPPPALSVSPSSFPLPEEINHERFDNTEILVDTPMVRDYDTAETEQRFYEASFHAQQFYQHPGSIQAEHCLFDESSDQGFLESSGIGVYRPYTREVSADYYNSTLSTASNDDFLYMTENNSVYTDLPQQNVPGRRYVQESPASCNMTESSLFDIWENSEAGSVERFADTADDNLDVCNVYRRPYWRA